MLLPLSYGYFILSSLSLTKYVEVDWKLLSNWLLFFIIGKWTWKIFIESSMHLSCIIYFSHFYCLFKQQLNVFPLLSYMSIPISSCIFSLSALYFNEILLIQHFFLSFIIQHSIKLNTFTTPTCLLSFPHSPGYLLTLS